MNSVKKLFSQSSNYLVGNIIVMLAGFISFPLWTRILTTSDYGMFSTITITITFLTAFLKFGNQQSIVRYHYEYHATEEKRNTYYSTFVLGAFFVSGVITLLVMSIILVLSKNVLNPTWVKYLMLAVLAGFLGALYETFLNFYRAKQLITMHNIFGILSRYGELSFAFVFVVMFSFGLYGLFIGQILSQILVISLIIYFLIRREGKVINLSNFNSEFLKETIKYGFPLIWLELSNDALSISDRYLILFFKGTESVAIYSAGYNAAQYCLGFLYRPLWLAIVPLYLQMWSNDGREKTEAFLTKTLHYFFMIGIPIIFGISYLGKGLVTLLATSKYQDAYIIMPYVSASYLIFGLMPICSAGIHIQKKTNILMKLSVAAALANILLNIFMVPWLGILGAAIATLISYILLVAAVAYKASNFLTVKINFFGVIKYIIISSLMIYVMDFYNQGMTVIDIIVKVIIGSSFYLLVLLFIDSDIRNAAIRSKSYIASNKSVLKIKHYLWG
ncbi:MAG: oligosaccharide flippase family protein [Nitrospirae bacterium]|nr:oligosaccharide flippase family protein [Nitrospirota bacterium]